jgi:hypothetical protein
MNLRALLAVGFLSAVVGAGFFAPVRTDAQSLASTASSTQVEATSTPSSTLSGISAQTGTPATPAEVEQKVRSYFADIPVMIAIAKCESNFRQFADSGRVLYDATGAMVGVFQFNVSAHSAKALLLGYDLTTLDGNLGYARYVYGKQGTDPWISSFSCWNASAHSTASAYVQGSGVSLSANLSFGMVDPQVAVLQKLLNSAGFEVAGTGPGSPGNETTMFGALTRDAVRRFQCAEKITCSGDEYSTGYGYVDSRTRQALLSYEVGAAHQTKQSGQALPAAISQTASNTSANQNSSVDQSSVSALQSQITALVAMVAELERKIALLS